MSSQLAPLAQFNVMFRRLVLLSCFKKRTRQVLLVSAPVLEQARRIDVLEKQT